MIFVDPEFKPTLEALGLGQAEEVWALDLARVDDPNRARGGWSEVVRLQLSEPVQGVETLYIKRQQDFGYREWPNIFIKRPTLQHEYQNLTWCERHGIPVAKPLAYYSFNVDSHQRAILITAGLTDYLPVSELDWPHEIAEENRKRLLRAVARTVFQMHREGLQHNCLYPKHVFVHKQFFDSGKDDVRLIDLEKARPINRWNGGIFRDLDTLNRRSVDWSEEDREYFFKQYYQWNDGKGRVLWDRLARSYLNR